MKKSHRKIIILSIVFVAIAVIYFIIPILYQFVAPINEEYVILDTVQVDKRPIQFYINYSYDAAILGFSVKDQTGRRRYFPMYGSTYRGMPSVRLDVFLSDTQKEMWVISSWEGYEKLGYYHVGDEVNDGFFDTPTPKGFSRSSFADIDLSRVKKIRTITHNKETAL